ncbi:MAG: tetratricopeptide repeat protein [Bacteroidota bacterium]|nr:tetratricopeptide repeat protein [Bacteroidota bacterium]
MKPEKKKKIQKPENQIPKAAKTLSPLKYLMWIPFVFAFILYGNSIMNNFVLDDLPLIVEQRFVQQGVDGIDDLLSTNYWSGSQQNLGYYRPLSQISFALEVEVFGNNPHVMHFFNVLLYALTGLFLFLFLNSVFRGKILFALFVSLLFIAHPVHTEVIANIKSRDEILAFLNSILAFWFIWKYTGHKRLHMLILSWLFYFLALMSKETAITSLAVIPLLLWFFSNQNNKRIVWLSLSFIGVSILFLILKQAMIGSLSGTPPSYINVYPYQEMSGRIPTALYILGMYFYRTVFPLQLLYDYSYNQIPVVDFANPLVLFVLIIIVVLIILKIKNLKRRNLISFSIIYFGITLSVGIAFILMRGGIMAERFLYAPILAFSIMLAYFLFKLMPDGISTEIKNINIKKIAWFTALSFTILLLFSVRTISRNPAWENNYTLFSSDIVHGGNSSQLRKHYGSELINLSVKEKDEIKKDSLMQAGILQLNKSLEINPNFGDAWFKLGYAYYEQRKFRKSIEYYEKGNMKNAMTLSNLALSYYMIGEYDIAYKHITKSLMMNPHNGTAKKNLALVRNAWMKNQKLPDNPDGKPAEYFYHKGNELARQNDFKNALLYFKKAIKVKRDFAGAMVNMGNCYYMLKDFKKAKESFEQALIVKPDYKEAKGNLDRINAELKILGK